MIDLLNEKHPRREFLRQLLSASAASPLLVAAASPSLSFPVKPIDRLAVTSWPFRKYLDSPSNKSIDRSLPVIDMKDFPALIVQKFGVRNINPLASHFRSSEPAYLDEFREATAKAGSHIVDLGLSGSSIYDANEAKRRAAIAYGRQWIDIAVRIGSPSVRQHVSGAKGTKPDVALAAETLGQLADYGSTRNVVINLENDNAVAEDPFFLVAVIERVNSPYLRALPDFGNSLIGHDAAFNKRAVTAMLSHAFNMCHVKDTVESDQGSVQTVDLPAMFQLAKAASYKGYFSMECDVRSSDPFVVTQSLISQVLKYLT
jgi:sugar phosphate isomerase/epimerase